MVLLLIYSITVAAGNRAVRSSYPQTLHIVDSILHYLSFLKKQGFETFRYGNTIPGGTLEVNVPGGIGRSAAGLLHRVDRKK